MSPPEPRPPRRPPAAWFTVVLWVLGIPGMVIGGSVILLGVALGDEHGQLAGDEGRFLLRWLLVAGVFLVPWSICVNRRTKGKI